MKSKVQSAAKEKITSPREHRLFRLADGSWLQTVQTGERVLARGFSMPFETTPYVEPYHSLNVQLEGGAEVSIPRGRKTSPFMKRPEIRRAQPEIPQAEAGEAILRHLAQAAVSAAKAIPLSPETVPQTPLRRFYEFLTTFRNKHLHEALAVFLAVPQHCQDTLGKLFSHSREHCRHYDNAEGFHGPRQDDWRLKSVATVRDLREAVQLVPRIGRVRDKVPAFAVSCSHPSMLDFKAVAYEVNPFRSTDAVFENTMSARKSGGGGINLLLCAVDGGLPIVAEVKAHNDGNSLSALVQALTYASELLTPKQFSRLSHIYPNAFGAVDSRYPCCDLYLINFQADTPHLFEEAVQIARLFLADTERGADAQSIRRIAFLKANSHRESEIKFECCRIVSSSLPTSSPP